MGPAAHRPSWFKLETTPVYARIGILLTIVWKRIISWRDGLCPVHYFLDDTAVVPPKSSLMIPIAKTIISICWGIFCVVWLLAAIFTKRTVYRESSARRWRYLIPIVFGWFLIFRGYRLAPAFNIHLIPETEAILVAAAILCLCGLALCLWARAVLGRNWSGTVTLKEDHELIVRGPYRLVRHPIYTGLIAMLIATWLEQGHIAGMIGLVLAFISFWIKSNNEEEVMRNQFPDQYHAYAARVKRIIPFIL